MPDVRLLAGRYQLQAPLGRGTFGEVWRARDVTTRRPVAVKIVELGEIPDAPLLAELIARFRREAITAGQLRHPNIVAAYEAGRVAGELFLAMELVEGASLARVIEQRRAAGIGLLPIPSVLDLAEQVSAGLAAAHAADIVHRDVKPGNLMVTPRLHAKIIDFGLARLLADRSPRLTMPSTAIGTPVYMSPEQAAGVDVDSRADLYSFGCVLYELLAGEPPFIAETPEALLTMQQEVQAVPLRIRRPDVPADLEQLIAELMAKDRESRPAHAGLVGTRIKAIRAVLPDSDPLHEADRGTVNAADQAQLASPTATIVRSTTIADARRDDGWVGPDVGLTAAADGATVLAPAALQELTRPGGLTTPGDAADGPTGTAAAGRSARWPTPPQRPPRRRRWRAAASTLVTVAILAAAGVILWQRAHDQLKVTAVVVAPAQLPGNRCNVTVNVVGTIQTNGRGGTVSYEWIRGGGLTSPVGAVIAGTGHAVRVVLRWTFRGNGTYHAEARLRVLTPDARSAQTAFTYLCTG